ncbi:hypothetical protein J4O73_20810 [Methylobacterium sp. NFXW15]
MDTEETAVAAVVEELEPSATLFWTLAEAWSPSAVDLVADAFASEPSAMANMLVALELFPKLVDQLL